MKCPECESKIGQKDYDVSFQWYECPKCEGCFTGDEIMEAELEGNRSHSDSRRSSIRGAGGNDGVVSGEGKPKKKVVAKAKKKKSEIDADNEAIAEYEKRTTETVVVQERATKHRDEISMGQVVNIMADEIETIYAELGEHLDRTNAEDKALTLWRNMVIHDGIGAREKPVPMALCKEHS